jgi:hypothetical protein
VSFVVAPIPVAILSWIAFFFLFAGVLECLPWLFGERFAIEGKAVRDWPLMLIYVVQGFAGAMRFVPPAIAAFLLGYCARRSGRSWKWTMASSILIGLAAGCFVLVVDLPAEAGMGKATIGFGFGLLLLRGTSFFQFLVPLTIGGAMVWNERRRSLRFRGHALDQ